MIRCICCWVNKTAILPPHSHSQSCSKQHPGTRRDTLQAIAAASKAAVHI
jgi:hypothetical protein